MPPRIRHNIALLGAIKILNYLVPIITLPYLTYTLGLNSFGKVAFAQAFSTYFLIIIDYGFSWSATKKISENRFDNEIVSRIFSNVWWSQSIISIISIAIAIALIYFIPAFQENSKYLLTTIPVIISSLLTPLWLAQGLERMREIAYLQISSKISTIPALFFLIKSPEDGFLVPLINSITSIIAGIIFIIYLKSRNIIQFKNPDFKSIRKELIDGSDLFLSKITISLYTALPPLLLALISGTTALGLFNIADKIRQVAQSAIEPISQALFPRMSYLYKHNHAAAHQLLHHSIKMVLVTSATISATCWILAEYLVTLIGGSEFKEAIPILKWLSFLPLFTGISNIFGVQVMLSNNLNKPFNLILITSSLLSLPISWVLINKNEAIGTAQTFFICELLVTLLMGLYLLRNGYLIKK